MQDPQDALSAPATPSASNTPDAQTAGWERQTLEQLAFANLNEQRTARRWKVGLRLAWLLLIAVVFWQLFSYNSPTSHPSMPHTAMVSIVGEIGSETPASAENVMSSMRLALEDSGSQALILLINSPGGSPVQAGLINDEITRLRALHNKPIYAVVEESCASAAYYIAAAADRIYVDKRE
jgi:protease-4